MPCNIYSVNMFCLLVEIIAIYVENIFILWITNYSVSC